MSSKMSLMPNISIPRSRFKQNFNHSLDMFHGDVVPVDCFEVIPGDEFKYDLASLIRMSTPIVPIMGNIKACIHAFFVPLRIIWDDAEKFYGDPTNHDKVSTVTAVNPTNVLVPSVNNPNLVDHNQSFMYSVQDYLGKADLHEIYLKFNSNTTNFYKWLTATKISKLKERCYLEIWNDHFRPSLMVPPVLIDKSSATNVTYGSASFLPVADQSLRYPFKPLKGFKNYDYFTANTYSPQYSTSAVTLPLGDLAPVYFVQEGSSVTGSVGSPIELKTLPLGAITMTLECGVRFLTDYLDGDKYFKVNYPEHNLVRSKCQLKLAKEMIKSFNIISFHY